MIHSRPQNVAFKPERVYVTSAPSTVAADWVINSSGVANFINEDLLAASYAEDRRKAGRKIRQQRRRLRRINAQFGHGPSEGVPASILRAKVVLI